jgi:ubiquinone/menaquinone biosynthesis C-methylase UbiE
MPGVDLAKVKERQRFAWGLGEYSPLSRLLRPAAEALRDACAVSAGQEVLDVAAGDGNFALLAAREGATVVASDLSPGMVERGRARSESEGYAIEWMEADAEELPFEDGRFDCVGSVFGAMIAPRPRRVAEEMFRVTRPGGTVGMTAWTPESALVKLFSVARRYQPIPPDMPSMEEWGNEETARERFDGLAGRVELERRSLAYEAESLDAMDAMLAAAPMSMAMRQSLDADTYEKLTAEQRQVAESLIEGHGPVRMDAEYLLIVARKPG